MPNIIPPIVSSSPPPLDPIDDDEDENEDDFGDFTAADLASHTDPDIPKTVPDTLWALPTLKHIQTKSEIYENGVVSLELSLDDTPPQSHTEVLDDDEILQNADSTSHDSVVSAVTDSGNCSASQNSSGTSPMPNVEVVDDEVKLVACHSYQNGSAFQLRKENVLIGSDGKVCILGTNQTSSEFNEADELENRTVDVSNETVDHLYRQSDAAPQDTDVSTLTNSLADQLSSEVSSVVQQNKPNSETTEPNNNAENQRIVQELSIIPKTTIDNDLNSDDFGGRSSIDASITNEFCNSSNQEKQEEEWNDMQFSVPSCEMPDADFGTPKSNSAEEVARNLNNFENNEYVRGMIIPEMPCLDYDDDDDDFGDFSGMVSPSKSSSGEHSVNEPNSDPQFQSPSRRPTLVLSDDIPEISGEHQPQSASDESDAFKQPLDDDVTENSSSEINTSEVCPITKKNVALTLAFNPSVSEIPLDEFADFTQTEVDDEAVASDVWAQAAQASSIQSVLPPEDLSDLDDFDDFESAEFQPANLSSKLEPAPRSYFDLDAIRSSLGEVLKENFPVADGHSLVSEVGNMGTSGLSSIILDVEESGIWQGLRDLEATPSLSFQWPGSHSNRGLLGALNIDSRNILFGPKWNTVVPRFAANLGFSPLEPVRAVQNQPPCEPSPRTEIIQPTVVETIKPSSSSEQGFQEVVPAAQFDWSDSGLTNPLDSNKDPSSGTLATTAASGNPVLTTTPLQVEQLLASSKRTTPSGSLEKKNRDPSLSPEAVRVLDTLPELAFLSARMLMFPVQGDRNENKL